ncbi:uncharacterized protein LOC143074923 [Mytilus galloprovincialis]|uniref:uncharacterized protein LOC143060276 n=1 Tax=Mytilus galloprovincialis TaxID=29158 RepID=UPI003F7C10F1
MSQTQIVGPNEQNESYEEDFTDDNDESKISLETCKLHYLTCKEQLYEIINCQDISCKRDNHSRHHDFIANPLNIYQRERVTVGFGMNVIKQRAMEYVHDHLFNDMLCNSGRDPKHPYTKPGHATISGMENKQLNQTFNVYRLASQYLNYVLVKEMIIGIDIAANNSSYRLINSICQDTEKNLTTENRKRRKLTVYKE